jgi:hypothetical protein
MDLSSWVSQVQSDVKNIDYTQSIDLLSFLDMMRSIQNLYPILFPEKLVLKQLNKDIDDGIMQTKKAMTRLGIDSGSIEYFIKQEVAFHNGNMDKCKNRKISGIVPLLWLNRILWFVTNVVVNIVNQTVKEPIKRAYSQSLRRYHGFVASKVFETTLSLCTTSTQIIQTIRKSPTGDLVNVNLKLSRIYMNTVDIFMKNRVNFNDKL